MTKIVDFVHLHCHSEYSLLDGMPKVEDYIIKCNELGFPALALTEHGNLRSLIELVKKSGGDFQYEGTKYDFDPIKPIVGCEFYLTPTDYKMKGLPQSIRDKIKRRSKNREMSRELTKKYDNKYQTRKRWHLLMFAKNQIGYENILTLNYLSWKNGFYFRPRIDMDLVRKYHEGIIITTTCIGGTAPNLIIENKIDDAYKWIFEMKKIFKDDLYVEIQPHNIKEQETANKIIVGMADDLKLKIVATNDCHYLEKDDYKAHNMLLDINSRASQTTPVQDRWRFGDTGFYMKSKKEMFETFAKNHTYLSKNRIKESLENTVEISDKCNVKIELNKKKGILPKVVVPNGYSSEKDYVIKMAKQGLKWRNIKDKIKEYAEVNNISIEKSEQIYKDRLKLELKRIFKMKYTKVFLIIQDMIGWARDHGIMVGPGRGSSAASLVCYLLGITSIDPVRYDLLFDRFLHEKRTDYPDVDMDFEDTRRNEIFEYLFEKYGYEKSAKIGTIGRLKGKQALQDVGRVLGVPMWETTEVTKHIVIRPSGDARVSQTVEDSFREFEVSRSYNERHPEVLPYVKKIEGKARHTGVHAAGIVLSPFELYKYIPIEYRKAPSFTNNISVSGVGARDIEDMGLIKFDLLGLSTLSVLRFALEEIKRVHKKDIDLEKVSLENKDVLDNFTKGNFAGIFQFDSIGMRNTCEEMDFDGFEDVIALNALYRPGCIMSGTKITAELNNHNRRKFWTIDNLYKKWINASLCIKNVKRNFNIVSYDELNKMFVKNKIIDVIKSGKKECFEIILQGDGEGTEIINNKWNGKSGFSKKHQFLTLDEGWKENRDIKYGDYVLYRLPNTYKNKFRWTKVLGIKFIGMHETYDIVMESPYNNFIAGGMVVHNSMRSGMAKHYIDRKMGREKIEKKHPLYDEITKNTYGIVVYQEQLMQVFMKIAGYQPSKADLVRKKVAKSGGVEQIWNEREDFLSGAKRNKVPLKLAKQLFKDMSFFGSYAFNKGHSAAYSVISYWGMWLKTYYPTEYFYALLKKEGENEKIKEFIKEAKSIGIKVVMPNINISDVHFSVVKQNVISVGLIDIKGCGEKASNEIVNNRPYTSIADFCSKVNRRQVNKGVIKALVKVGAFNSLYPNVGALLYEMEWIKGKDKMSLWEIMVSSSEKRGDALYNKISKKKVSKISKEEIQRNISSVSALPPDKHEIEYYKNVNKYFSKRYKYYNIKNINYDADRFILKGIIADIKYNQIGDFYKEPPTDIVKKRIQWGQRYVNMNLDDGTSIKRMKIDIDVFSTFRHIIDGGLGTPVAVMCKSFPDFQAVFVYNIIELNDFRKIIDNKKLNIKEKFKSMDCFQRYFVKHPLSFYKKKNNLRAVNRKKVGVFEVTALITKVKYHWTKKSDKKMAFIDIEDEYGTVNIVCWNNILQDNDKILKIGNIIKTKIIKKGGSCFFDEKYKMKKIKRELKYL